jgi:NADH-quinone oxidoreductase subunit E
MTVAIKHDEKTIRTVDNAIAKYGTQQEELIPILSEVNNQMGYLSPEAMEEISTRLHVPQSQVLSVASFYDMLATKVQGKHVIKFCESAPCHIAGGREVIEALKQELNIKTGETTKDKKWTLRTTSCLGICAVGPVILIDDQVFGNLTVEQIPQILSRFK